MSSVGTVATNEPDNCYPGHLGVGCNGLKAELMTHAWELWLLLVPLVLLIGFYAWSDR